LRENEQKLHIFDTASSTISMMRNQLALIQQRVLRIRGSEEQWSCVEQLTGSSSMRSTGPVLLLGMLSSDGVGVYRLEDMTGSIAVDMVDAQFRPGVYVEGNIVLIEGRFEMGVLHATAVDLPPFESSTISRANFGNGNFFGGPSPIAVATNQKMQALNNTNPNASIAFLSDVNLDNAKVLKGLRTLFEGFVRAQMAPIAFVFCGNFCSKPHAADAPSLLRAGFTRFATLIAEFTESLSTSSFILVPGPDDPAIGAILPRPPLPGCYFDLFEHVPNVIFASNPCRLQYANREIVVFRNDIVEKMCRNSIYMPVEGMDVVVHVTESLLSAGHLSPLPRHVNPILASFDHCLRLYPIPDAIILADSFRSFAHKIPDCTTFINPSSFARSDLDFYLYYPCSRDAELSSCVQMS